MHLAVTPKEAPVSSVISEPLAPAPYLYTPPPCPTIDKARLLLLAAQWREVVAARGVGAKYAGQRHAHLVKIIEATQGVLDDATVTIAVGQVRATGLSTRTANKHLSVAKSFTRWLARPSRRILPFDPLAELTEQNVKKDRRRERTSFSDDQWLKLFQTTLSSRYLYRGIPGRDRAELYHGAACTGLREGTMPLLEVGQFYLDTCPAFVMVRADQLKDGEDLTIPIQAESAGRLRMYFASKMPTAKAFRCPPHCYDYCRMLQADLAEAGVVYCRKQAMANGRVRRTEVLDFHSMRHTFGTRCASAGIPLTTTQKMMGHSDPSLTANVYNHVLPPDLADAMRRLPALPGVGLIA